MLLKLIKKYKYTKVKEMVRLNERDGVENLLDFYLMRLSFWALYLR